MLERDAHEVSGVWKPNRLLRARLFGLLRARFTGFPLARVTHQHHFTSDTFPGIRAASVNAPTLLFHS